MLVLVDVQLSNTALSLVFGLWNAASRSLLYALLFRGSRSGRLERPALVISWLRDDRGFVFIAEDRDTLRERSERHHTLLTVAVNLERRARCADLVVVALSLSYWLCLSAASLSSACPLILRWPKTHLDASEVRAEERMSLMPKCFCSQARCAQCETLQGRQTACSNVLVHISTTTLK